MPTNLPIGFYIIYALLAGGGVAGFAQILSWFLSRKKHEPEVENIISESARNAVEAMSSALDRANLEINSLRTKLETMEDHYEKEIAKLVEQITDMRVALGEAEYRARALTDELAKSKLERKKQQQEQEQRLAPPQEG